MGDDDYRLLKKNKKDCAGFNGIAYFCAKL